MNFDLPPGVLAVLSGLHDAGFDGYIVGGAVRDISMDKLPHDYDITTNALPMQIKSIFKNTVVSPAPSIYAASEKSLGKALSVSKNIKKYIPRKYDFINHIPTILSRKFKLFAIANADGSEPTIGTVMPTMTRRKRFYRT